MKKSYLTKKDFNKLRSIILDNYMVIEFQVKRDVERGTFCKLDHAAIFNQLLRRKDKVTDALDLLEEITDKENAL